MSDRRQFLGMAGVPVGGVITVPDGPVNFTDGANEYLRTGAIKTYSAPYAAAISAAPQLRVFGTPYGTPVSAAAFSPKFAYIGGNYAQVGATGAYYTGSLASAWSSLSGGLMLTATTKRLAANATYAVGLPGSANQAHLFTSNGTSATAVGGTFTTCPVPTAMMPVDYTGGLHGWLGLSSLNATAGEQSYIANANPSGTWTVGAGTNVSMSTVAAIASNGTYIVAAGTGSGAAGWLATCTALGGTWTDRSAASGMMVNGVNLTINDVVYDGTNFIAYTSGGIYYAADPTGAWTLSDFSIDLATGQAPASMAPSVFANLVTNGAGTTMAFFNGHLMACISTNHGVNWSPLQVRSVTGLATGMVGSYCNSKWLTGPYAYSKQAIDLGDPTSAPGYVGFQTQINYGNFVRIR